MALVALIDLKAVKTFQHLKHESLLIIDLRTTINHFCFNNLAVCIDAGIQHTSLN